MTTEPDRLDVLRATTKEKLTCPGAPDNQHALRGYDTGHSFCLYCDTPEQAYRQAQDIALLLARIDELQARVDVHGKEFTRWFDVHQIIEEAISKDSPTIDTYLLADALGPEESTP